LELSLCCQSFNQTMGCGKKVYH